MSLVAVALAGLELLNCINKFDYLFVWFFRDAHHLIIQHSLMDITPSLPPRRVVLWVTADLS